MTIRLAQSETKNSDIQLVYDLSNDPDVRKNSFSHEIITWEEHRIWYSKTIHDPDILFFLIFDNKDFVGQIRFDRRKNIASPIINISITKKYRGKGFASDCLKLAVNELKINWTGTTKINAHVLYENKVSNIFFVKNGFELITKYPHNVYELII